MSKDKEEIVEKLEDQKGEIDELKAQIDVKQKIVEQFNANVDQATKLNKIEEEKFRKLSQMNAALKAKLEFIQMKYDFTSNVTLLQSDDFNSLIQSNNLVRIFSLFICIIG